MVHLMAVFEVVVVEEGEGAEVRVWLFIPMDCVCCDRDKFSVLIDMDDRFWESFASCYSDMWIHLDF